MRRSNPAAMASSARRRARSSVAKARGSSRNMLRGNWSVRISAASAPSGPRAAQSGARVAAASHAGRKRSRIVWSSEVLRAYQPSAPTSSTQKPTTSAGDTSGAGGSGRGSGMAGQSSSSGWGPAAAESAGGWVGSGPVESPASASAVSTPKGVAAGERMAKAWSCAGVARRVIRQPA